MVFTNKHIVDTYTELFEGLSSMKKIELTESITRSLKVEMKTKDEDFL